MGIDTAEYHEQLFQEIHGLADADGKFAEDAFFEVLTGTLIDAGEIDTADRVHHMAREGFASMVMGAIRRAQTASST